MPASSLDSEFREGVIHVVTETDGIIAISLEGDFDLANAPTLGERVSQGLDTGTGLIIDLSDATFIDSTVIQVLVQAARAGAERGKPVVLQLGTAAEVERTIKIVGIERVLPRAHERQHAVAMIRQRHAADGAAST